MIEQISKNEINRFVEALKILFIICLLGATMLGIAKCAADHLNNHPVYTYEILDKNEAITSKFLVFGAKTKYIVTLKNTTTEEVFTTNVDEREFYTWKVGYTIKSRGYSEEYKLRNKN